MRTSLIQHGEPRRFVMSAPIPLRRDFGASQLRGLARKTKDGPQARRLLALAAIYDGATRTEAAMIGGVGLQIIRDWVLHFNERGPDGLLNGKSPGQPSKLNDVQRQAIAQRPVYGLHRPSWTVKLGGQLLNVLKAGFCGEYRPSSRRPPRSSRSCGPRSTGGP